MKAAGMPKLHGISSMMEPLSDLIGRTLIDPRSFPGARYIDNFFSAIKSLNQFDHTEVHNIVSGQIAPTLREKASTLNYHRAEINIELLLTLTDTHQFQAVAMIARSVFEIAIEIRLILRDPDAGEKISLFTDLEKLRSAKQILQFAATHPSCQMAGTQWQAFVSANEQRLMVEQARFWPGLKKVKHWSGLMDLARRAEALGHPFDEMYQLNYPQLSWYVHSGVTGVANPTAQLLAQLAGVAYIITFHSYSAILESVIEQFHIEKADPAVKTKLAYAKHVAFTTSQEEADQLLKACTNA
jgi:Family of unknown function (DUF5677)